MDVSCTEIHRKTLNKIDKNILDVKQFLHYISKIREDTKIFFSFSIILYLPLLYSRIDIAYIFFF